MAASYMACQDIGSSSCVKLWPIIFQCMNQVSKEAKSSLIDKFNMTRFENQAIHVSCTSLTLNDDNNKQNRTQTTSTKLLTFTVDCIDYVTGIGNAHAHNGVHSVLRLDSQLLVVPLTFL